MTDLQRLIEAVECGDAEPLHFDAVWNQFGPEWPLGHKAALAFYGSLDAAKALHDALLPGWGYDVKQFTNGKPRAAVAKYPYSVKYVEAMTPARAWLIAILKAYQAQQNAT